MDEEDLESVWNAPLVTCYSRPFLSQGTIILEIHEHYWRWAWTARGRDSRRTYASAWKLICMVCARETECPGDDVLYTWCMTCVEGKQKIA
jgi:hypothetical protein